MTYLAAAYRIAAAAHEDQRDLAGRPRIEHSLRMAFKCGTDEEKAVALLHEALETGRTHWGELESIGLSDNALYALECLERGDDQEYEDYIDNVLDSHLATTIKILDLEDNMDITRLHGNLDAADMRRIKKYHAAHLRLTFLKNEAKSVSNHQASLELLKPISQVGNHVEKE